MTFEKAKQKIMYLEEEYVDKNPNATNDDRAIWLYALNKCSFQTLQTIYKNGDDYYKQEYNDLVKKVLLKRATKLHRIFYE